MLTLKDSTKQKIYDALHYDFIDKALIKRTYYAPGNCLSNTSYLISKTPEKKGHDFSDKCEVLEEVFQISNKNAFETAYKQAISGSGHEEKRISVMHSSSLCALLCFYKVSDKYPITINGIRYNQVYFEVQNTVFENPSNMDVVLVSDESKSILFLESKFSEYLSHGKCSKISAEYADKYDKLGLKDLNYQYEVQGNAKTFELSKGKNDFYIGGIKQMISHYLGVTSFCETKHTLNQPGLDECLASRYEVTLGEILFDAWGEDAISGYKEAYKKLAEKMNAKDKETRIRVLDEVLTYQKVFKYIPLEERIKEYYGL